MAFPRKTVDFRFFVAVFFVVNVGFAVKALEVQTIGCHGNWFVSR